jgi:hypothetical protein
VLPAGWTQEAPEDLNNPVVYKHIDGREQSDNPSKPEGIIAIANAIPDMRAMTKFDISLNDLRAEGGKALAAGLKGNQVITELNISSNILVQNSDFLNDISGIIAIANAIPDMEALLVLSLKSNDLGAAGGKALAQGLKGNQVITELNIATNHLCLDALSTADMSGFVALADAIPDMRAISSVNILFNDIGTEQAQALGNVLKEHATLKSLCGNKGNETELDLSGELGKRLGAEGAIMLAPEIADNRLSVLNLSDNALTRGAWNRMNQTFDTDMTGV